MPGVPESFKVLIKELESLALNIRVLDRDKNEIIIKELDDEDEEELPIDVSALSDTDDNIISPMEGEEAEQEDMDLDDFDVDEALDDINLDDMDEDIGFDDDNEDL